MHGLLFTQPLVSATGGLQADEQVVQALEQQGALRDRIWQDLVHNQVNSLTASYFLLQQAYTAQRLAEMQNGLAYSGRSSITRSQSASAAQHMAAMQHVGLSQSIAAHQQQQNEDSAHTLCVHQPKPMPALVYTSQF